jgi:hypothetical protein
MSTWRAALYGTGLSLLAGLLYLPALPGAFHFDDFHSLVYNQALALASVEDIFTNPALFSGLRVSEYRPLTILSFALQAKSGQLASAPLIAVNIAIHAAASGLFFWLMLRLCRSEGKAALAAAVFAFHPIQSQAVNYISCRGTLLASAFALASLLALLSAERRRGARAAGVCLLSLLLFAAALLSKAEVFGAALFPGLLYMALPKERRQTLPLKRMALGFLLVAGVYLLARGLAGADVMIPARPIRPIGANLATGVRASILYLGLALWPLGLSVVHDFDVSTRLLDPRAIAAALALFLVFILGLKARKERPLLLPGLGWYLLALAPTHTLVPLHNVTAEHHAYFGMAGVSIILAELTAGLMPDAERWKRAVKAQSRVKTALPVLALAGIVVSWAVLVEARNRAWQSEAGIWESAALAAPASTAAWDNLGVAWWEEGMAGKSRRAFEMALAHDPKDLPAQTNLGRIYVDEGKVEKGAGMMEAVLAQAPYEPEVHYNLARAYAKLKKYRLAEKHYREALKLMPGYLSACENLAELYVYDLEEGDKAREIMGRCLALRPSAQEMARIQTMVRDLADMERPKGKRENNPP